MTMQTILRPLRGSTLDASVSTTHAVVGPFLESKLGFYSDVACYIKFGVDNTVVASAADYDIYVPAATVRDIASGGAKYASVLGAGSGTAYINEWTAKAL